jgi:hypothetical protein
MDRSLTEGFVGPTIFAGCWGCCGHDGRVILVGHRGHGALIKEGPPLVLLASVLLVGHCSLVYATPASPISILTLNCDVAVTGVAPHWSLSLVSLWHAW